jgi:hypothetical protein
MNASSARATSADISNASDVNLIMPAYLPSLGLVTEPRDHRASFARWPRPFDR